MVSGGAIWEGGLVDPEATSSGFAEIRGEGGGEDGGGRCEMENGGEEGNGFQLGSSRWELGAAVTVAWLFLFRSRREEGAEPRRDGDGALVAVGITRSAVRAAVV